MSDRRTIAERVSDEVDEFFRLWRSRRILAVLILFCIAAAGAYLVIGRFQQASTIADLRRDIRQIEAENKGLRETVAPLIAQAAREFPGEEISEALERIIARLESEDPLQQPIASASASVRVVISSEEDLDVHYMGRGGYVAFARGDETLLIAVANESYARQTVSGEVEYTGLFQMPATDSAVGKPISFLQEAEYLQISFRMIPPDSRVLNGEAIIVINGSQRFEFQIAPQTVQGEKLFVRGVKGFMK